ncbi:hypothetical protein niasHT_038755 [Heterodera trifolii]|uniref:Uncharacterized protein n=1 Tax=Heterodera trifolii TaxID=157864 RepID=A0ABD2IQP0_9BILA
MLIRASDKTLGICHQFSIRLNSLQLNLSSFASFCQADRLIIHNRNEAAIICRSKVAQMAYEIVASKELPTSAIRLEIANDDQKTECHFWRLLKRYKAESKVAEQSLCALALREKDIKLYEHIRVEAAGQRGTDAFAHFGRTDSLGENIFGYGPTTNSKLPLLCSNGFSLLARGGICIRTVSGKSIGHIGPFDLWRSDEFKALFAECEEENEVREREKKHSEEKLSELIDERTKHRSAEEPRRRELPAAGCNTKHL